MDASVRDYIKAIPREHRPLFLRLSRLVLKTHPDAAVVISYKMPTYKVGKRRLYIGAWKHGLSLYGCQKDRDGGFSTRHPDLLTGRGTIRLRADDAAHISDKEFKDLARAALDA